MTVTALTITGPRAELLRAINAPDVRVFAAIGSLRGSWADADVWLHPTNGNMRKVTGAVGKLEQAGLVKRDPVGARYHSHRHYTLTTDGEKALADYDAPKVRLDCGHTVVKQADVGSWCPKCKAHRYTADDAVEAKL